jgi:hypothetical protein
MQSPINVCLLGILVERRGYKCYDPVKNIMFKSLDVIFREREPYFILSNAQSNTSPMIFQDPLEMVVTLP